MLTGEREVGGLRCSDVLERLSEYVDGELPPDVVARIHEHLRGCDACERFGTRFAGVVRALRQELAKPDPVDADIAARLRARLAAHRGRP
jgi:anti-sigma factor RsiW